MVKISEKSISETFLIGLEYGSFEYLDGCYDTQLRPGGYRPLINYFRQFISDPNRIRLNNEVISVKFIDERHQLEVQVQQKNSSKIQVFSCEHLVWTSSLGFLKENFRSIFSNEHQLIEQKQSSIEHLGFDTINKVKEKRFFSDHFDHRSRCLIIKKKKKHFNDTIISFLLIRLNSSVQKHVSLIERA